MKKYVSILISAFNAGEFIEEAVDSCLNQTYKNIEIIIYNDGSQDNTKNILNNKYLNKKNIKIINNENNLGKIIGFNQCFKISSGDYIHLLGADDILYPYCIEECVKYLNSDADAIFHSVRVVDSKLKDLNCSIYNDRIFNSSLEDIAIKRNGLPSGAWMISRYIASKIFPIPEDIPYEDIWFGVNIKLYAKKIVGINKDLSLYRQHKNSVYGGVLNNSFAIVKWRLTRDLKYINYIIDYNPFCFDQEFLKSFVKEKKIISNITSSSSLINMFFKFNIPCRIKLSIFFNSNEYLKNIKRFLKKVLKFD